MSVRPETHIHGTGYGSSHSWIFKGQGRGWTTYRCASCAAVFTHRYDDMPDIFKAIKAGNIVDECPMEVKS